MTMLLADSPGIMVQAADYTAQLTEISGYLQYLTGFAIFAVVVTLCYFVYKFFRMFF